MIKSMVGDILSFRIAYWEEEDEPGTLRANKRTMLGFALPRVDRMCSTSCLKACEHLALLAIAFWFELGLNLPQRSDAWRASSWSLFSGKSVFLGKKQTCSSLPGFYGSHIHTVLQLPLRNEQANRNPDFFFGIMFSHPFPTPFLFSHLIFCHLPLCQGNWAGFYCPF